MLSFLRLVIADVLIIIFRGEDFGILFVLVFRVEWFLWEGFFLEVYFLY